MTSLRPFAFAGLSAVGLTAGAARADWHHGHHHHDHDRPKYPPVVSYRPAYVPAPCPAPVVTCRPACPPPAPVVAYRPVVAVPPAPCGPVARPSAFRASLKLGPVDIRVGSGCR